MEIIRGIHNIRRRHAPCVATMGSFDGVHRGHRALLARLARRGRELGVPSLLVTFEPQPREYLGGGALPARLTRFREKIQALRTAGADCVDRVLCIPFDETMRRMPARDVVEQLLARRLGVRHVVVGDDFRFGRERAGDYALLREAGERLGFGVEHMGTLACGGQRISSSRIRAALAAGDCALAQRLLGRPYAITGRVAHGRRIGRGIGIPTANIPLRRCRTAVSGVFAATVEGLGGMRIGAASVGVRPTVEEDGAEPLLEVHILDFDGCIYGRLLTVALRWKIRDERRFASLAAMRAEIARDIGATRSYFARHPPAQGARAP